MKSRHVAWIVGVTVAVLIFVALPLITWAAGVWTDFLWYQELGQQDVFWTRIWSQLAVGGTFFAATFVVLFGAMWSARLLAPRAVPISLPDNLPEQWAQLAELVRRGMGPWITRGIWLVSLFSAWATGLDMSRSWTTFRLALAEVPFGIEDPQFGQDVGFYVFSLPVHELLSRWAFDTLLVALVLSAIVHVLDGAIQPWARLKGFAPHVKAHLSVIAAAIVLVRGYSYWIAIWRLNFSPRGQVVGASYTDVHAQLPAYWILIGISALTAVLLLVNIRFKGWRLPAIAIGGWIVTSIVVGGVYPALIQQYIVSPNEFAREKPYIERNIAMTRQAFDLSDVKGTSFPASEDLSADDIKANQSALGNVRLWDPTVIQQSYSQLQSIRPYYDFADVDVDRYMVGGRKRQVLVSAREMNSSLLAEQAQTWLNRHLVYTHGFGLVMSPVSESDSRGLPQFYIGDIPPRVPSAIASASPDLVIEQPRLYYGEDTTDYVIVGAEGIDEFDFPQGDENAEYRYDGDGGVAVGGFFQRVAWALRLGSSQLLLSDYVGSESRVLLRRDLNSRLQALAPWLTYDRDPYPILVDGRVLWVVDAYTRTAYYPYSQNLPDSSLNYMHNAVKVTVDAFTGETHFYAFDEDPILAAWSSVFPDLITDASQIPEGVREHFRYPQDLFEAQAEIYRTYHMTNAGVFYNKEDQWEIPGTRQGQEMPPYFVLLQLPGQSAEHFYLFQPYTPRTKDNMIGWIAASSDPENYGERTVFQFPKDRVILGPEQVSARINQDPIISPQLTLWNQRGSGVLFGNMLVIPIEDSIVYIQPLFLQAEKTAIPELTSVIVVYADKMEMKRTLVDALLAVFGESTPRPSAEETGTPSAQPGISADDAATAQRLFDEAIAAQRQGDWGTYGDKLDELGDVLDRLAGAEGTAAPSSP